MPVTRQPIDYPAAAEQLLAVLAARAEKFRAQNNADALEILHRRPVEEKTGYRFEIPAARLARLVFGEQAIHWTHETRRRRIRETVVLARRRLTLDQASAQIAADGAGYWIATDAPTLARYAALRRRRAIASLVAAAQVKPNISAAAGQLPLTLTAETKPPFGETPAPLTPPITSAPETKGSFRETPVDYPTTPVHYHSPAPVLALLSTPTVPVSPSAADSSPLSTPVSGPREGF